MSAHKHDWIAWIFDYSCSALREDVYAKKQNLVEKGTWLKIPHDFKQKTIGNSQISELMNDFYMCHQTMK